MDPFKPAIDVMPLTEFDAPRKQRRTVKRIYDRLLAEEEMEGISYAAVCDYVHWRRPRIRVEAGRDPPQMFVPPSRKGRPSCR
ncbi:MULTISPECIES: hypothetical protein [unclassified Actinoplanes]|uniref:hypothetical protein n=1 Tax=unclassified Actinoplanes TaxID=2626549 RepID=UPI0012BAC216|nr:MULTISPECIES: hypothetical protein [unclassified Actinoplanes]